MPAARAAAAPAPNGGWAARSGAGGPRARPAGSRAGVPPSCSALLSRSSHTQGGLHKEKSWKLLQHPSHLPIGGETAGGFQRAVSVACSTWRGPRRGNKLTRMGAARLRQTWKHAAVKAAVALIALGQYHNYCFEFWIRIGCG